MRTPGGGSPRHARHTLGALLLAATATAAFAADAFQWYQHYEQAQAHAAAGEWEAALSDFSDAAKVEPRPRAEIRTYGNRFLFGYDPQLGIARCALELGRLDQATTALAAADDAAVSPPAARDALRAQLASARKAALPTPPPAAAPGVGPPTVTPGPGTAADAVAAPVPPRVAAPMAAPPASAPTPAADTAAASPVVAESQLAIDSAPAGATVRLDGQVIGVTPLAPRPLRPGPHRAELLVADEVRWSQPLTTVPGQLLRLEVSLPAVAKPAAATSGGDRAPAADTAGPDPQAPAAGGTAVPSAPPPAPRMASGWRWWAGGLTVGALAAILIWRRRRAADGGARRWHLRTGELRRVGDFAVEREIGRGGMATTWLARRRRDGLAVALKIPHDSGDPTYRERFLREGHLGETLHHPGIVRILEVGEDHGVPYLAMELLPGQTLRQVLDTAPQGLPWQRAVGLLRAIAEAVDYAHGKGVIHRDLKPENIMLLAGHERPDGSVKVMDFGVARLEGQPGLTTSQVFFGSPLYAAPESIEPRRVDRRSDLYALGVLLYELLVGRPPFVHESVFKVLELHRESPLPAPPPAHDIPTEVWQVVARLAAKEPADRYQSAQELLVAIDRLAATAPPSISTRDIVLSGPEVRP